MPSVAEAQHRSALRLSPLRVSRDDAVGDELERVALAIAEAGGQRRLGLLDDLQGAGAGLVQRAGGLDAVADALGCLGGVDRARVECSELCLLYTSDAADE